MEDFVAKYGQTPELSGDVFRALYDLAVSMTADHTLEETLGLVVERVRDLLGSDTAYIALIDENEQDVYMHSLSGIRTEAFAKMRVPLGTGLGGLVAATRRGYVVEDYFAEARIAKRVVDGIVTAEGLVSGLAAPVIMGGENLGVLYAFNRSITQFTNGDLKLLHLIASLAAVEVSHKMAAKKLRLVLDTLEDRVAERTRELNSTTELLKLEAAERRRSDEVRELLEGQLIQAQKMEAIGRLAGGIAHDFNNLLTAIIGHAEIAETRLLPFDPARLDIERIKLAGVKAAALTQQLLAYSRKQVLQPQVIDLSRAVDEAVAMLRRLIGEHIDLAVNTPKDLPPVKVDPGQLQQVIMNLAINARDALEGGGILTLETSIATFPPGGTEPEGVFVRLTVADTGQGIDEETLERIFEPFFTTKELGKGTGMGLATVHGIVGQSGGFIRVTSEVGRGTAFRIYLPAATDDSAAREDDWLVRRHATGETVLIVEDDPDVRGLINETLLLHGYSTLQAGSGEEALGILADAQTRVDLLLTDVVMRGMNGRVLSKRASEMRPGLRILFMSGYTEDASVLKAIREEKLRFIQKPFIKGALIDAVRDIMEK